MMLPNNKLREFPVKAKRALFADHNRVPYQGYRYEECFIRMCDAFNLTYKPDLQEIWSYTCIKLELPRQAVGSSWPTQMMITTFTSCEITDINFINIS